MKDARIKDELIESQDMKFIMSTAQGRRFVWKLMGMTQAFGNPMTGNSYTFYHLGVQNVGKSIWAMAWEHRDLYILMENEQKEGERE